MTSRGSVEAKYIIATQSLLAEMSRKRWEDTRGDPDVFFFGAVQRGYVPLYPLERAHVDDHSLHGDIRYSFS